jgi:uncharacterized membrane protein YfcA
MDSLSIAALIAAVFVLAGFVKGVIGLGLPTVAVGLLVLSMTPAQAAAILLLPSLVTNVWQFAAGHGWIALAWRLWPLLAGICFGTVLGVLVLPVGDGKQAILALGLALSAYAALGLGKIQFTIQKGWERSLGLLTGITTGAITVAAGVFVIPSVPFIQALQLDRNKLVQALGLSFTVSTATLAAALWQLGEMKVSVAAPAVLALAAALVGMVLGQIVRGKVAPDTFRRVFLLGLFALGLHLVLRGLW